MARDPEHPELIIDYDLTPRDIESLLLLAKYQVEHGATPTFAELGRQMGITGSRVRQRIDRLIRKGVLPTSSAHRENVYDMQQCFQQMVVYICWNGSLAKDHPLVKRAETILDRSFDTRRCEPRAFMSRSMDNEAA